MRIYNGFQFDKEEDELTVEQILTRFDTYPVGETNETYERYVFHQRNQKEGETFENFLANRRVTRIFLREGLTKFNLKKPTCSDILSEHKMSMRIY